MSNETEFINKAELARKALRHDRWGMAMFILVFFTVIFGGGAFGFFVSFRVLGDPTPGAILGMFLGAGSFVGGLFLLKKAGRR